MIARAFSALIMVLLLWGVLPVHQIKALTISPPTFDFSVDPGATELGVIKIYNEEKFEVTYYPILFNFTFSDESGTPSLYPADEDREGTSMAKWITLDAPQSFTLAPEQRISISYSVKVPNNAQPGGHYGAVVLSSTPPGTLAERGVGVGAQLGALILMNVSGEIIEKGSIAEFRLKEPRPWFNSLPIEMMMRFENQGTSHLRPTGHVSITNMFGSEVANIKVNETFGSVLPKSIRKFDFVWVRENVSEEASALVKEFKNFGFGRYKATLFLNYGKSNALVTSSVVFYVWPWRLMLITVVGLLVIWWTLRFMKRRYDRSVISNYEKRQMRV